MRPVPLVLGTLFLFGLALVGVVLFVGGGSEPAQVASPDAHAPGAHDAASAQPDAAVPAALARVERAEAKAEAAHPEGPVVALAAKPTDAQLTAAIHGTVHDDAGNAVAGAAISLEHGMRDDRMTMPLSDFEAKTESAQDGSFQLAVPEIGVFRISVVKAGFCDHTVAPLLPNDDVAVVLKPGKLLAGLLREESTGLPVPEARVRVSQGFTDKEDKSDSRGAFALADLGAATSRIEVFAPGYDVLELDGVMPGSEGADALQLDLVPGLPLIVAVVDGASGQPIRGASLEIAAGRVGRDDTDVPMRQVVKTDATGSYRFDAMSRHGLELLVRADGYAAERKSLDEEEGADEWRVEVGLVKSCSLAGVVTDSDSKPIAHAKVSVRGASRFDVDTRDVDTDDDGHFTFTDVRPGADLELVAFAPGTEFGPCRLQGVTAAEGETVDDLALMLEPAAAVTVTVLDTLGQPVPYARVLIEELPQVLWRVLSKSPLQFANEQGQLGLEQMPSGNVKLSARLNQFYSEPLELTLVSGQRAEANLQLLEGLVITGRVTDPAGEGIDDAVVMAFAMDPNFRAPTNLTRRGGDRGGNDRGNRGDNGARGGGGGPPGGRGGPPGGPGGPRGPFGRGGDGFGGDGNSRRMFGAAMGGGDRNMASFRSLVRSGGGGEFVLKGLRQDEKIALSVRHENYAGRFMMNIDPLAQLVVVLQPKITLVGMVVDASTRKPLVDFSVSAEPVRAEGAAPDVAQFMNGPTPRSESFHAQNGAFALADLQPGAYQILVRASGYKESEPKTMQIGPGQPPVILEAARAAEVKGRLTARSGASVPRLNVFLAPIDEPKPGAELKLKRGRAQNQRTNKDGGFRFRDVKEGWYALGAGNQRSPAVKPTAIHVDTGEIVETSLMVEGVGQLVVKLDGKGGLSLAGATLQLECNAVGYRERLKSDSLGKATFNNLVSGTYTLNVTHPAYTSNSKSITLREGDDKTENVSLGEK